MFGTFFKHKNFIVNELFEKAIKLAKRQEKNLELVSLEPWVWLEDIDDRGDRKIFPISIKLTCLLIQDLRISKTKSIKQ